MQRKIERKFIAVRDSKGAQQQVEEQTPYTLHQNLDGSGEWVDELRSYHYGGGRCNKLDDGAFEVVRTGERLVPI